MDESEFSVDETDITMSCYNDSTSNNFSSVNDSKNSRISKLKEIKEMITYAGVSSFYLGKKGLAYVKKIII